MPKINVTTRTGDQTVVDMQNSLSIMENLRAKNVGEIQAVCGGNCACGTCHVYVSSAFREILTPISDDEDALLDASPHRTDRSRLSCQLMMTDELDGITITIAPED